MKRIVIILFLFLFSKVGLTQTNVFPASGNVGVGTATPQSKLHIRSVGTIGGLWNPANSYLRIDDGSNSMILDPNEISSSNILHFGAKNSDYIAKFRSISETVINDKMVIKSNGKVGIGTIAPESILEVYNSGTIGGKWNPQSSCIKINHIYGSMILDGNEIYCSTTLHIGSKTGDIVKFRSISDTTGASDKMIIKSNGNVGIGTTTPGHKLDVNGTIRSKEIKVETGWSDFVFEESYNLKTLEELETYISQNKHLPDIPTEAQVKEKGVNLGEMNAKLLQKVEELTLYIIEQNKGLKIQRKENQKQKCQIEILKEKILKLEKYYSKKLIP